MNCAFVTSVAGQSATAATVKPALMALTGGVCVPELPGITCTGSRGGFPGRHGSHANRAALFLATRAAHLHQDGRDTLKFAEDFVIHGLRHTFGTRLGESGADAFTIMKLMGHSSITISQRYVHPSSDAMQRAIKGLETVGTLLGTPDSKAKDKKSSKSNR